MPPYYPYCLKKGEGISEKINQKAKETLNWAINFFFSKVYISFSEY